MNAPFFYSPQAKDADMVSCHMGHEILRKTALFAGRLSYSTYGCPYCLWTQDERRHVFEAYELGVKDGRAGGGIS